MDGDLNSLNSCWSLSSCLIVFVSSLCLCSATVIVCMRLCAYFSGQCEGQGRLPRPPALFLPAQWFGNGPSHPAGGFLSLPCPLTLSSAHHVWPCWNLSGTPSPSTPQRSWKELSTRALSPRPLTTASSRTCTSHMWSMPLPTVPTLSPTRCATWGCVWAMTPSRTWWRHCPWHPGSSTRCWRLSLPPG